MKRLAACAVFMIFGAGLAAPRPLSAQSTVAPGTVTATFTGLRSTRGVLRVVLFDAGANGKGFPADTKAAKVSQIVELSKVGGAGATQTTVAFANLAPGTYAVAAYHDENLNSKMDMHWYGKPKEGSAASNDPRPKMRAPKWNEATFDLPASGKSLLVKMWYP